MKNIFLKNRSARCAMTFKSILLSGGILLFCFSNSYSGGIITDSKNTEKKEKKSQLVGLKSGQLNYGLGRPPFGTDLYRTDTTLKGILKRQLIVTGTVRFLTIYRNMSKSYDDMTTSDKNISFLDYPITNVGIIATGGFPVLELNIGANVTSNFNFNVGYSFAHSFSGNTDTRERKLSSRQNLYFTGRMHTYAANISLMAGGILWTSLSRFTMGQPIYRSNYFERLPWDWYRQSFQRFDDNYTLNADLGSAEAAGRTALQGFIGTIDIYRLGISVTQIFGRTNNSVSFSNMSNYFPSYTYGTRIEKSIFTRHVDGRFGFNYYRKAADTDKSKGITDNNQIASVDMKMKVRKILYSSEFAVGKIENPTTNNEVGTAFSFRADVDRKISSIPFGVELYTIDYNIGSIDGGIINTNTSLRQGGFANEFIYDAAAMINCAQEVGQIANNRQGVILNAEKNIGKFKITFGTAFSREIENRHDSITIQHRANAFTRSRFRPWFQAGGPYGRVKSIWRNTFETLTITDTITDYNKGFNGLDVLLRYKFKFLGKDIVILNFYNYNSIQDKFSPIPEFTDKAFVRTAFTDITIGCKLGKKYTVSAYAAIERIFGGMRIDLADANGQLIKNTEGRPEYSATGKPIDQTGHGYGLGVDYDFSPTAGLHLRHTWFNHEDKNFTNDKFKGQETTFELKIFF